MAQFITIGGASSGGGGGTSDATAANQTTQIGLATSANTKLDTLIAKDYATSAKQDAAKTTLDAINAKTATLDNGNVPMILAATKFINAPTNNSSVQLAAGASFVGGWDDVFSQPAIQVLGNSDQPMKYTIEQAIDALGTDIVSSIEFVRNRSEDICENVQLNGNYCRVTCKNIGYSTTTLFELNCTFGPLPPMAQGLSNYGNQRVSARETQNFNRKLRDAMQTYPNANWPVSSKATGDIIQLDGNAAGASYLALSLDPLSAGTESYVETDAIFKMPLDIGIGLHASQRTLGQELTMMVVNGDEGVAPVGPSDLTISAISQTTTTLTVTTSTPHNLKVGSRIGIYGVLDSRFNYPSLVVSNTTSLTQFVATAGPGGTISSVTATPTASGFVYARDAISFSSNGTSLVFENTTTTNGSMYVKSEGGAAMPIGGTLAGAHSATTQSTASVAAATASRNYAFRPTTQFILSLMADKLQWSNVPIDSLSQPTNIGTVTQNVPSPDALYKLRFKVSNRRGLTVPVAKIVSVSKTGTTTATVTTDVAHGLTTADFVNTYGVRDLTNFANLSTATAVASIVSPTQFTIIWGAAVTATSYGGLVARVNGGVSIQGAISLSVQSANVTSGILTLVGSGTWTGFLIGDYVNLHGCRDSATGADMGLDGTYRVVGFATTNLLLEAIGTTTLPGSLVTTNCGGAIIKRTDLRISFVRMFEFERLRTEMLVRPSADGASAAPVAVASGALSTVSAVTAANLALPGTIADVASAAITTTATTAALTPTFGTAYQVNMPVTAVTGTTPTLDMSIEESTDSGTNWFKVYDFPRITATGFYNSPILRMRGNRLRYVQTLTGTTPSFTRAVNRSQISHAATQVVQLIDRTIVPNTLNSTSPALLVEGCQDYNFWVRCTAQTTAATITLQFSDDNVNWHTTTNTLTTAVGFVHTKVQNEQWKFARAIVSAAGTGITLAELTLKAVGM